MFSEFETNDNSLVLSLEHLGKRLLWTGDVEFFGERELLKKKASLRADVIKAAHHGSNTSSQEALVRAVRPQHVLFTVPQRSRFGFPKSSIKKRWLSVGSQLWSTGDHGLLHLTVDEAGVQLLRPGLPMNRAALLQYGKSRIWSCFRWWGVVGQLMPSTAATYSSMVGVRPRMVDNTTTGVEASKDSPFFSSLSATTRPWKRRVDVAITVSPLAAFS